MLGSEALDGFADLHPPAPGRHFVDPELPGRLAAGQRCGRQHVPDECKKRLALLGASQSGAMGRVEGSKTGAAPPSLEAALAPAPADNSRVLAIEARRRIPDLALDLRQRLSPSRQAVSLSGKPL